MHKERHRDYHRDYEHHRMDMQMHRHRDREYHERDRYRERDMHHHYMSKHDEYRSSQYMEDEYERQKQVKAYTQKHNDSMSIAGPSVYDYKEEGQYEEPKEERSCNSQTQN